MKTEAIQKSRLSNKIIIVARNRTIAIFYFILYACLLTFFIGFLEPAAITTFQQELILSIFMLFLINTTILFLLIILWYIIFRHIIARGPLLTVTDSGIEIGKFVSLSQGILLPWSEITNIYALSLPSQKCLIIRTHGLPKDHYLRIFNAHRVVLRSSIRLPNTYMKQSAPEIVKSINRFYAHELQAHNIQLNQSIPSEVKNKSV